MEQLVTSNFKLGIIAGGQLGKMLALAASNWDVKTYILDPDEHCPASTICTNFTKGNYSDYETVYQFGKKVNMLTFDIENINTDALLQLKKEGTIIFYVISSIRYSSPPRPEKPKGSKLFSIFSVLNIIFLKSQLII